jgi:hypothetical protein
MSQRIFRRVSARLLTTIRGEMIKAPNWETRFNQFCGAVQAMVDLAATRGVDDAGSLALDFGRKLAKEVIAALGRPPIEEPYQALFYMGAPEHQDISFVWQRDHPEAMRPFVELLPTVH